MAHFNETPTFAAGAAIGMYLRCKLVTGVLQLAGAGDADVGVSKDSGVTGDHIALTPPNAPGLQIMICNGDDIAAGGNVYGAADGKVSGTAAGKLIGINAGAAVTTDGDWVTVLRTDGGAGAGITAVETKTANFDIEATDSGKAYSTVGAGGTVVASLPAAVPGLNYFFRVGAVQELRIDPDGTETISLPSTGVPEGAGEYITANAIGESVAILCVVAGTWSVVGFTGTWTGE